MKSVTFDNSRGLALGFDETAPSPFVTWQFTETENGQKDYYWGHYHSSGQTAVKDFAKRVADYKELFGVHERTSCRLHHIYGEVSQLVRDKLESYTFASICACEDTEADEKGEEKEAET